MLKAAAERLRLRAGEKISSDCSTSNLVVARLDLAAVLDALDLADGVMPPKILSLAKSLRSNVREARYAAQQVDAARMDTSGRPARELYEQVRKWSDRTVDAAASLVDAVLAYEHTGGSGAPSAVSPGAAHVENEMSNTEQVREAQAEVYARVQRAVDRNVAARSELDASNQELADTENELVSGDANALNFLRAYRNPTTPNPAPIAPDVAVPPPQEEPPVFTDISTPTITPDTTSGGSSDVAASLPVEEFPDLAPVGDAPAAPADTPVGGEGSGSTEAG